MDEREWLDTTNPLVLLAWLQEDGRMSDYKYQLFVVACLRSIFHRLSPSDRRAVEAFEAYSIGMIREEEWDWEVVQQLFDFSLNPRVWPQGWGLELTHLWDEEVSEIAAVLSATGMQGSWEYYTDIVEQTQRYESRANAVGASPWFTWNTIRHRHCILLRDIFGNPFRPLSLLNTSLLTWNGSVIQRLAQQAYDDRLLPSGHLDPNRLAVLADALEDARCDNAETLDHLRAATTHVRGCFVVDLLLDKR